MEQITNLFNWLAAIGALSGVGMIAKSIVDWRTGKSNAKLKAKLDEASYISKLQYNNEYEAIMILWEKMNEVVFYTGNVEVVLKYHKGMYEKESKEALGKLIENNMEYRKLLSKTIPLLDDNLFESFDRILDISSCIAEKHVKKSGGETTRRIETKEELQEMELEELVKKAEKAREDIRIGIKRYLRSTRII